jgi:hypothetical protein
MRSFFCPRGFCRSAPTRSVRVADTRWCGWLTRWLLVELLASVLTLAGIYVGSTTAAGAALYRASLVFWYALTCKRSLWGLMPLNIASTVVASVNLWRAMAA